MSVALDRPARSPAYQHYSLAQIVLHWLIAALVLWQLFISDNPELIERMARRGRTPSDLDAFLANSHVWVGIAILVLVSVRLVLRLWRPTPPPDEPNPLIALAARASHAAFYVLLFAMPLTGIGAYYLGLPVGGLHELGKPLLYVLIAVHAAAALWHQFVRRDGMLMRMVSPARG